MVSWIVALAAGHGPDVSPCFWAYLDPGSGSMLFQVLIAGLLSALLRAGPPCSSSSPPGSEIRKRDDTSSLIGGLVSRSGGLCL